MAQPHVSIKPELITEIFSFPVTNSYLTTLVVLGIFLGLGIAFKNKSEKKEKSVYVFLLRFILSSLYKLFEGILGKKARVFFPLLSSFFLFILISNWFGLLPGVGSIMIDTSVFSRHAGVAHESNSAVKKADEKKDHHTPFVPLLRATTADLNTTVALGLISVALIQFFGIYYLGFVGYLSKFITFKNPIAFFTGVLEIISEVSKIISFAFRLFGNIFAGEVLLVVVAFLVPVLASFPFLLLEIFVGFIQALVFTMLTAVFLNMAIAKHH